MIGVKMGDKLIQKKERKECIVLGVSSFCSLFALMLQTLLYGLLGNSMLIHIFVLIVAAIPTIRALPIWLKYEFDRVILCYGSILIVFLIQYMVFLDNRAYMTEYLFQFLFMCIPAYLSMSMNWDTKIQTDIFKAFCWNVFVLGELYFFMILVGRIAWGGYSYNMAFSYYMLLPALGFTYCLYRERKKIYIVPLIFAMISIIMLGSRGPLLCWVVFFLFGLYFSDIKLSFKCIWTVVIFIIFMFYKKIIMLLLPYLDELGINSRSMEYFITGSLVTDLGGRDTIYSIVIELIKQNFVFGSGIGADLAATGQYSHNLFLDLLLHYGVFLGISMILIIIVMMWISLSKTNDKTLWFVFFCGGFLPSMVSGTYLSSMLLWIFFGYCRRHNCLRFKLFNISIL